MRRYKKKRQIRRSLWLSIALTFILMTMRAGDARAQNTTQVRLIPQEASIHIGQTVEVLVQVENVVDLYGVDLILMFSADLLDVVDADPDRPGVQITPGNFLSGGYQAANNVTDGNIEYIMQQVEPQPSENGTGVLARIAFRGTSSGVADIRINDLYMSDRSGQGMVVVMHNASITVLADGVSDPQPTDVPPTAAPLLPATPTAAPTLAPPPPQPTAAAPLAIAQPSGYNCANIQGYHVVRRGETLYAIARAYATDPYAVGACNPTINPRRIHAGNHLAIPYAPWTPPPGPTAERQFSPSLLPVPVPTPAPGCRAQHVVQHRETLTAIGLHYNTNIWDIARANRIYNLHLINTGQVLCIP